MVGKGSKLDTFHTSSFCHSTSAIMETHRFHTESQYKGVQYNACVISALSTHSGFPLSLEPFYHNIFTCKDCTIIGKEKRCMKEGYHNLLVP